MRMTERLCVLALVLSGAVLGGRNLWASPAPSPAGPVLACAELCNQTNFFYMCDVSQQCWVFSEETCSFCKGDGKSNCVLPLFASDTCVLDEPGIVFMIATTCNHCPCVDLAIPKAYDYAEALDAENLGQPLPTSKWVCLII
jgi:hypothetical protein